jgi:hypothetical protein
MSERSKTITNWLFWGAFAVFLGVSIPHIAWVVRQYTPQDASWYNKLFYGVLSLGYAVAIDGIMAWLTHAQSQHRISKQSIFTWTFIVILVAMSWYLNWVYNVAHDPSKQLGEVWQFQLFGWWILPSITVGAFTPVLLGALPVFTIAYVSVLNNVNQMKTLAAKSLAELAAEADDIEQRRALEARIKNAGKKKSDEDLADKAFSQVSKFGKKFQETRKELVGERKEKLDPQIVLLNKILDFYRDTPHLLTDPEHLEATDLMIKNLLKLKKIEMAIPWRIKAAQVLQNEVAKQEEKTVVNEPVLDQAKQDEKETHTDPVLQTPTTGPLVHEDETDLVTPDETKSETPDPDSDPSKNASINEKNETDQGEENQPEDPGKTPADDTDSDSTGSRASVSIKEAALILGLSEPYVRTLLKNKKLRNTPRNEKLITMSSINRYQSTRQKDQQNEPDETRKTPVKNKPNTGRQTKVLDMREFTEVGA